MVSSEYRVVTPEEVEFVYELAGPASRAVAAALDHLLLAALLLVLWLATCWLGLAAAFAAGALVAAAIAGSFLLYFGYFAGFEWRWNGQTPGKRLLELRAIDDRGLRIDLFQALLRNLFRIVDMMPLLVALDFLAIGFYGVGGLSLLLSPSGKRLGDRAAGTLVVRTRRRVLPEAILAPEEKYNTLLQDPATRSRIRARLTLEEREVLLQLCLRRGELELPARQALFAEAAAYLERRLDIPREAFLSEEKFVQNIAAVALSEAGARRRKDGALASTG